MSLFEKAEQQALKAAQPLAARMRPHSLDAFVGQQHVLGPDGLLRRLIRADRLGSIILYGPPGTGKTTLARILASATQRTFCEVNAVLHGVKELRGVLERARDELAAGGPATLLFIDEIHRFNKAQQDAVMSDVEQGIVSLVGATTANPYFAINAALVSRSQVFQFEPLEQDDIVNLLQRAIADSDNGLGQTRVTATADALQTIARICDGDARRALGMLETAVLGNESPLHLTTEVLAHSLACRSLLQDDDTHYDTISALIKSIRGSDPDAGIYWLARMLESGEQVRFLCRRLVILASEDIGNADPRALPLAVSCMQACEFIGLPECQLTLSQTVTYLACAEIQCVHPGDRRRPAGYPGRSRVARPSTFKGQSLLSRQTGIGSRSGVSVFSRSGRWGGRSGLSGSRTNLLPTGGSRFRTGPGNTTPGHSPKIAGWPLDR